MSQTVCCVQEEDELVHKTPFSVSDLLPSICSVFCLGTLGYPSHYLSFCLCGTETNIMHTYGLRFMTPAVPQK